MPEVTSPPPTTGLPWRAIPGPVIANGASFSAGPASRTARTASEPMKPVSSLQHQPRPASIGPRVVHQVVAVEVEADLQAQRVARAEPGGRGAGLDHRVPDGGRARGGDDQLDAVLARVAGAADEHAVLRRRRSAWRSGSASGSSPSARPATIPRASGPWTASIARSCRRSVELDVEALGVLAEPGEVALVVGGVGDRQEAVAQPVGEEVVEHAAVLAGRARSTARRRRRAWRRRWRGPAAGTPRRRARSSRSRPCGRRRRRRRARAPPRARRGCPRTARASPSPRTARAGRRPRRGGRGAGVRWRASAPAAIGGRTLAAAAGVTRRGRDGGWMTLAALAAGLLAPAAAQAGSYDVVACNAPGAGGVNRVLDRHLHVVQRVARAAELRHLRRTAAASRAGPLPAVPGGSRLERRARRRRSSTPTTAATSRRCSATSLRRSRPCGASRTLPRSSARPTLDDLRRQGDDRALAISATIFCRAQLYGSGGSSCCPRQLGSIRR